jgi:hypothetical protein
MPTPAVVRFVSGHDFSRAEQVGPGWALAPAWQDDQGLKPISFAALFGTTEVVP